jgi:hypothetical protein
MLRQPVVHFDAGPSWHPQIGDHNPVRGRRRLGEQLERFAPVLSLPHLPSAELEVAGQRHPHRALVVDDEDKRAPGRRRRQDARWPVGAA